MTKFAVARQCGRQVRFFGGDFTRDPAIVLPSPITTGQPDQAKAYDEQVVADLVVAYLNLIDGLKTGAHTRPWIVMELPEAWTS